MKILFLGKEKNKVLDYLQALEDVMVFSAKINENNDYILKDIDFIVSYGYRYIIAKKYINEFSNKIINMHISLLPWNKGSDPNLWSFLDDTPKGVTIHYMDETLDTGDIILQKEVIFSSETTLATTYAYLSNEIEDLFIANWEAIKNNSITAKKQPKCYGSYHKSIDKDKYLYLLKEFGWNTKVSELIGKAK